MSGWAAAGGGAGSAWPHPSFSTSRASSVRHGRTPPATAPAELVCLNGRRADHRAAANARAAQGPPRCAPQRCSAGAGRGARPGARGCSAAGAGRGRTPPSGAICAVQRAADTQLARSRPSPLARHSTSNCVDFALWEFLGRTTSCSRANCKGFPWTSRMAAWFPRQAALLPGRKASSRSMVALQSTDTHPFGTQANEAGECISVACQKRPPLVLGLRECD